VLADRAGAAGSRAATGSARPHAAAPPGQATAAALGSSSRSLLARRPSRSQDRPARPARAAGHSYTGCSCPEGADDVRHAAAVHATAPVERRAAAIEAALEAQGWKAGEHVAEAIRKVEEDWQPANGARLVAKAWCDPDFKRRLLADGRAAALELGFEFPAITGTWWCWRTRRRCTTSSAARCAPAPRSPSSACRPTGTRTSSTAPASSASRARC
jgi:hypothetical protein